MLDQLQTWWQELGPDMSVGLRQGGLALAALLGGYFLGSFVARMLRARNFDAVLRLPNTAPGGQQVSHGFTPTLVAGLLRGAAVGGMFFFVAAIYFLLYETLHALYHMPPALLRRWHLGGRLFSALQAHHAHHHRLDRMSHVNFNVAFPLMDWVMRTNERPSDDDRQT